LHKIDAASDYSVFSSVVLYRPTFTIGTLTNFQQMIEIDFWKAKKCYSFILVINICILIDTSQCLVEGRVCRCFSTFLSYIGFLKFLARFNCKLIMGLKKMMYCQSTLFVSKTRTYPSLLSIMWYKFVINAY